MRSFLGSRGRSILNAVVGWGHVVRTQRNAWIHGLISIGVLGFSFWLELTSQDWASIILMMAMVWMAECFNTALEAVVDIASPQMQPLAKVAKDVSAAAVLTTALAAILIGLLILGPPFVEKLRD